MERLFAEGNRLHLVDGRCIAYDCIVLATGPVLAFDEIEGLGTDGFTKIICHTDHAEKAKLAFDAFCQNPGPIVVGAVKGASCFRPACEFTFILETALRWAKLRGARCQ